MQEKNFDEAFYTYVVNSDRLSSSKGKPEKVSFQFPERIEITPEDVLQLKMGNDYWKVIDTEEGQAIFNAPVLVELFKTSSLPDLKKEDAIEALNRLPELAKKEQTEEVISRVKSRLELVKSAIELGKALASIAGPALLALAKVFGLG